jgi:hypothetical protein
MPDFAERIANLEVATFGHNALDPNTTTIQASTFGGLTAGGQTNATPMLSRIVRVTTVAHAGDSVKLPPAKDGMKVLVINHGANAMQVFAWGELAKVNDQDNNKGYSHEAGDVVEYEADKDGNWTANVWDKEDADALARTEPVGATIPAPAPPNVLTIHTAAPITVNAPDGATASIGTPHQAAAGTTSAQQAPPNTASAVEQQQARDAGGRAGQTGTTTNTLKK